MQVNESSLKRSRLMYIFEATLEYLISILVAGSFLATLTKQLGLSDSLTGILSSIISLGCLFQLMSVTVNPKRMKPFVLILSILNQMLFLLLYVIPLIEVSPTVKAVLFVILIVSAYVLYNVAHPKKISWLMSLVDDHHRGDFTANKEIVSLISGIAFSFGMGALIDHYKAQGNLKLALILSAAVIFVLMVLHSLTLLFTVEKPSVTCAAKQPLVQRVKKVLGQKDILRVSLVFVLYQIAHSASTPFYGVYEIQELGFSLTLVSALSIASSIARILFSKAWGRYADRRSFAAMIEKGFFVWGISFSCMAFCVPSNGRVMFLLYCLLNGIAMGAINSALINLVFDYAREDQRADCLAVSQAFSGVIGFLTTLCVSPLVTHIQKNANQFLGHTVYAQQVVSAISLIVTVLVMIYTRTVLIKRNPKGAKEHE